MNGRLAIAIALVALASSPQAEIHTRSSFTITIGNRPPPRVVYVERHAPRWHKPKVVYVEPRRGCGPRKVVVIRDRDRHRHGWMRRDRHVRYEHGDPGFESRESDRVEPETPEQDLSSSDRDDNQADDKGTRPINR